MNATHSERLVALDVARGIAMLLVCTSHFLSVYGEKLEQGGLILTSLFMLTKVATPSFVLVSGILLGYFHASNIAFSRLRTHLLDRALFLLTVGHLLIAISFTPMLGWVGAVSQGQITDTLALCLLGGMVLLQLKQTSFVRRLVIGIVLYVFGWVGWNHWHPDNVALIVVKGIFLGPDENTSAIFWFPLIPWFGVYLVGTSVGSWLANFNNNFFVAGRTLVRYAAIVFVVAICLKVLLVWVEVPRSMYLPYLSLSKVPPGPLYLLTFGSAALVLLGIVLMQAESIKRDHFVVNIVQLIGRNSFSVFLSQSFLYFTGLYLLVPLIYQPTLLLGFLFLLLSLFCLIWLSGVFDRIRLSRAWTVGLPILMKRWVRRRECVQEFRSA